jgi:hypothetical protein
LHEQVDPSWATATTERIIGAFDKTALSASRITDVDCRATRCRVTVLHHSQASKLEPQWHFRIQLGPVLPHAVMSLFTREGVGLETVIHLSETSRRRSSAYQGGIEGSLGQVASVRADVSTGLCCKE